jgi:hypothetical protein
LKDLFPTFDVLSLYKYTEVNNKVSVIDSINKFISEYIPKELKQGSFQFEFKSLIRLRKIITLPTTVIKKDT